MNPPRIGLAAAILLAACSQSPAQPPAAPALQIGMVQGMFRDMQPAMVQAIAKPLRNIIQQQTGLSGNIEIVADGKALSEQMHAGKYQLGVFHGYEFAWARKLNPDLIPLAVTVPPARVLRAILVVQADSPAKSLSDLAEQSVLVPRGTKSHCFLYMESIRAGLPVTTAQLKTKPAVTSEEALDAVLQGDAPAALVDASALLGYEKLQPGAARQLRVLCQSEPFPPTVIAYTRGALPDSAVQGIRQLLVGAHQTPAGKPLMMLWNLKGFEDVPATYAEQLTAVERAYPDPADPTAGGGKVPARTVGRAPAP